MSYLLDTNIISELVRAQPNKQVITWFSDKPNDALYISVLTLGEIRKGVEKLTDTARKEKLTLWLEHELPKWFYKRILPIEHEVADRWGRLLGKCKISLPAIDSLLAATAIQYNLTLVTHNTRDFMPIPLLEIIDPWHHV